MPRRRDGEATRDKILTAAAEVFACRGYRGGTVAEIAAASGINGALISYYYGGKAELYRSAWDFAYQRAAGKYPVDGGLDDAAPAVKRLHGIIASAIARRSDPENRENEIMLNELSSPTGILDDVHARSFADLRRVLRKAVGDILGSGIAEEEQRLAVLSIFSMCIIPVKQIQKLEGNPAYVYQTEERIRHVYNFAMAGLLDILTGGVK